MIRHIANLDYPVQQINHFALDFKANFQRLQGGFQNSQRPNQRQLREGFIIICYLLIRVQVGCYCFSKRFLFWKKFPFLFCLNNTLLYYLIYFQEDYQYEYSHVRYNIFTQVNRVLKHTIQALIRLPKTLRIYVDFLGKQIE